MNTVFTVGDFSIPMELVSQVQWDFTPSEYSLNSKERKERLYWGSCKIVFSLIDRTTKSFECPLIQKSEFVEIHKEIEKLMKIVQKQKQVLQRTERQKIVTINCDKISY